MKHVKALLILLTVSACSGPDPRPGLAIPDTLLAPIAQPYMRGTTDGDVWRLIAAQKSAIERANAQLSGIACLVAARAALIEGRALPGCAAPDPLD